MRLAISPQVRYIITQLPMLYRTTNVHVNWDNQTKKTRNYFLLVRRVILTYLRTDTNIPIFAFLLIGANNNQI